jgi:hypothetical protein
MGNSLLASRSTHQTIIAFTLERRYRRRVITKCYYYNSHFYYSKLIANSLRPGMFFSSGDSPKHFHGFFRGEGLDERKYGESPLVISAWRLQTYPPIDR